MKISDDECMGVGGARRWKGERELILVISNGKSIDKAENWTQERGKQVI